MTAQPDRPDDAATPPVAGAIAALDDPLELPRFTRFETDAQGLRWADSSLRISGMHCAACAGLIEQAVAAVPGVRQVSVSAAGERARVRWDPARASIAAVIAAVQGAGYGASPDVAMAAREARLRERRAAIWRLFVAAFCGMQVMMLATPSYVTTGDELAPDMRQLLNWGSWLLSLPVLAFSAGPFFAGAWRALRQRRIGMDVPVALGIAVTFVASSGATFAPQGIFGREVYFDSLTMFVSFLLAGRLLETLARHRMAQTLEQALDGLPQTAERLLPAGGSETVSVQRLAPGDRVRVPAGQAFPGDGRIEQGDTAADEALLTGESLPVPKRPGDAVVGGSVNRGQPVLVRLERVGADTRLEGIVALMREAMSQRPALARTADRWAGPFLWAVLALAVGAAVAWWFIDPARAVWVAVSVLIVTCPCALSLAAPSALLAAASALARRGVLLQRLDALEALTGVQRVFLDKTGTLTDERLQCVGSEMLPGSAAFGTAAALGRRAQALAAWSAHPVARALVAAGERASAPASQWRAVQEQPGQGLQALDEQGRCWRLGQAGYVAAGAAGGSAATPGATPGTEHRGAEQSAGQAATGPSRRGADDATGPELWLGCEGQLLAHWRFDEALRPDAQATVQALQAAGLQPVLLSGDRPARARRMARRLGLPEAQAIGGATPERKLAAIQDAQLRGERVAMVGDGLNDAPVLARADVSFAMGQGALTARAQADAVIASGRLGDLLLARDTARRTMAVVRQNLVWAAVYNAACIPLALAGWLPPWAAGLGMAASSLGVIGNALRLMRVPGASTRPVDPQVQRQAPRAAGLQA